MWPGKSNLSLLKKNCWNNDQYFKCFNFQIIELEGKVLSVFETLIIFLPYWCWILCSKDPKTVLFKFLENKWWKICRMKKGLIRMNLKLLDLNLSLYLNYNDAIKCFAQNGKELRSDEYINDFWIVNLLAEIKGSYKSRPKLNIEDVNQATIITEIKRNCMFLPLFLFLCWFYIEIKQLNFSYFSQLPLQVLFLFLIRNEDTFF